MQEVVPFFVAVLLYLVAINLIVSYMMLLVQQDVTPSIVSVSWLDFQGLRFIAFVTPQMKIETSEDGTSAFLFYQDMNIPRVQLEIEPD